MVIYKITNIKNNKIYIGYSTKSAQYRLIKHFNEADSKIDTTYLNNAIRKHGRENFVVEDLDTAITIEELKQKEIYYIKLYNSRDKKIGYNLSEGGDGTPGVLKSAETREKIRQKALGRKLSEETKRKMSNTKKTGNYSFEIGIKNCKQHNLKTSKKVEKYDLNMNKLQEYNSISETVKDNNIDRSGITTYLNSNKFEQGKPYKGFLYKIKE